MQCVARCPQPNGRRWRVACARAHYRFVDGGVWANNPIMIGLVDALACFDIDPTQVRILSLGCGREPVRVGWMKAVGGPLSWTNVIFAAMDLQPQNALGQSRLLVGHERVTRLEPQLVQSQLHWMTGDARAVKYPARRTASCRVAPTTLIDRFCGKSPKSHVSSGRLRP